MPRASFPALADSSLRLFGTRAQGSGAGTAEQTAGAMPCLSFIPAVIEPERRSSVCTFGHLELARIGSQLLAFDSATSDQTAAPPLFDTFATRLSAQPLSQIVSAYRSQPARIPRGAAGLSPR